MPNKLNSLILCLIFQCSHAIAQISINAIPLETNSGILHIADSICPTIKGNFKLIATKESPLGTHYTLVQQYKGIAVFGTYLLLHINTKGKLYHYQSSLFYGETNTEHSSNPDAVWVMQDNNLIEMTMVSFSDKKANPWLALINKKDTFQKFPLFLSYKDSMVKAKVFLPNPITSSHSNYGSIYTDQNDANSLALDAQLKEVSFMARFDNGTFYLQNDFLTITEISNPPYPIALAVIPQFYYNRSQYQFEDVNAFYHLAFQIDYLQKLGIKN